MIKLLVICPIFFDSGIWKRWQLLAELFSDVDVTLLAPRYWEWGHSSSYSIGKIQVGHGIPYKSKRFRVKVIDMPKLKRIGWIAPWLPVELMLNSPDIVYYIGHDMEYALSEVIIATKIFAHKAKVGAFTMRGLPHDFSNLSVRLRWKLIQKYCDTMFCHYPEARQLIKSEGFMKPVYVQTQIGVDSLYYKRSEKFRRVTRALYRLEDTFVFGSASRLTRDKGLIEVINALPREGNWKFLMLGSGPKEEESLIREEIKRLGLSERVVLTGFIEQKDMPACYSAMDCFVHVPRTTKNWIDTFPLAVVQAMSSSLPIIVNNSGAMQYQVGRDGIIVPEGDIEALRQAMIQIMSNPKEAQNKGTRLHDRVMHGFDITHLAKCFNATMRDILNDKFDSEKEDQALLKTN
jgi:glycosyltransferase involved in cell wall biosynthesis